MAASQKDEYFRLLVESVKDYAIFMLDPTGHVMTWNPGAERTKGYAAAEIIGQHFSRFYPQDSIDRGWPEHELRVAGAEGRFEDEGWRIRKNGSRFWANVVITAMRDASGTLRGFVKVTRDLTQRRQQEESLRQSEERFRLLVEGVSDYAIFMIDLDGNVLTWNSGAQNMLQYESGEILGHHFSRLYPVEKMGGSSPENALQQAATRGRVDEEGWRVRKDGSRFWAGVTITALRDEAGQLRGFAKLTRDLSERRHAEKLELEKKQREELLDAERSARVAAQQAARLKDEFLATLSHELRTPLNAILGWTQILRDPGQSNLSDYARGIEVIERNARSQVQLIEDLLDLSRIMAGRMRLDVQSVSLIDIISQAIESAEPAAHAKSIRLESILDPIDGIVSGDAGRLQQVVWNLLSNAIKFTPKGGRIQILLQRINSHIEISVSDNGIGISSDFLPHVFERFSQNDPSITRTYGGLGLGLAITRQLVELHGGSVRVKSAGEGKGSTFIVNLPISLLNDVASEDRTHPTVETDAQNGSLPDLSDVHALIVDDEKDGRELLQRVLEKQGARVTAVESGQEALRLLAEVKPDIIISDIGMPGMDGYQLIRKLRSEEVPDRKIPALALTALARTDDRKRAILAGYQSHVSKPFDVGELVITVAGLLDRT
ncbi:MAG TPA: PAS domain S-box protein [Burkholderiales bacterium]|nr:PAS domain S-box protein [Burkholderiales bacterium]